MTSLYGLAVQVSPGLPIVPSPGEVGRRIVRHGLADVLRWLGEEVGPAPDEVTDMLIAGDPATGQATLFVSREVYDRIRMGWSLVDQRPLPEVYSLMQRIHDLRDRWLIRRGSAHIRFQPDTSPFRSEIREAMMATPVISRQSGPLRWQL